MERRNFPPAGGRILVNPHKKELALAQHPVGMCLLRRPTGRILGIRRKEVVGGELNRAKSLPVEFENFLFNSDSDRGLLVERGENDGRILIDGVRAPLNAAHQGHETGTAVPNASGEQEPDRRGEEYGRDFPAGPPALFLMGPLQELAAHGSVLVETIASWRLLH